MLLRELEDRVVGDDGFWLPVGVVIRLGFVVGQLVVGQLVVGQLVVG